MRVILLADAAKFGASVFAHIAPLERVDVLVTDARPPSHLASDMADAGIEIIVAE
jgi:DeoR family fructose operon transcriptional repressor